MENRGSEIAVVGIGLRFPGGIDNTEKLWAFLCDQGDASSDVPDDRWGSKRYYSEDIAAPSKTYMRRGSFIDQNIAHMDPLFFGISPREAACMDPQQRLVLEVVWEAMEDSGILPATYSTGRTGVFMGTFSLDWMGVSGSVYNRRLIKDHYSATAASVTMLAARVSHSLDLKGPSMSIDTACSSSLTAIHQACLSLATGESNAAIAGGVNIMVSPISSITMSKGHFLSVDGRCKSFSSMADGYGRGEGCGIVVLKRLSDAERDGDKIHAVIVGTGVNQDGRTPTLTTPSEEAQRSLILDVLSKAGLTPDDVGYVEAHGTGTPVGDPIEVNALGKSIGQRRDPETPLLIGSVKANIGHLEGAAGVAGLIKAILCLNKRSIPPQANLPELNKTIPFAELGIKVVEGELTKLPSSGSNSFIGVNSFGYGGTNAVAFLRSPSFGSNPDNTEAVCPDKTLLLPLNAMAEVATQRLAISYLEFLRSSNSPAIEDLCFSAARHRARLQLQTVIYGESASDIIEGLEAVAEKKASDKIVTGRRLSETMQNPVFVFSGMGSQWKGMGHHILRDPDQAVQLLVEHVDSLFIGLAGWSIIDEILRPAEESRLDEAIIAQPAIFVIQVVLVAALRAKGVVPSAIVGHSLGEVAAAYAAGVLSLKDAITIIYHRSRLQARLSGRGTMLAVALSGAEATSRFVSRYPGLVSVAAYNSGTSCTLAGNTDALTAISEFCHRDGIFNRKLNVTIPYHNPLMDEIHDELLSSISDIDSQVPQLSLYSTVTGERWSGEERHDALYWFANAREPVLFHDAIRRMLDAGHQTFLEIGAHPVLSALIRESAQGSKKDLAVIPTLRRNESESLAISRCLARLYIASVPLDWHQILGGKRIALPHYPWVREYFWSETDESRRDRLDIIVHPLLGDPVSASAPVWHYYLNKASISWVRHHQVDGICLFPAAGFIEGCIALSNQIEPSSALVLERFTIPYALTLDDSDSVRIEWAFDSHNRVLKVSSTYDVEENRKWTEHASCTLLLSKPWPDSDVFLFDSSGTQEINLEDFYSRLSSLGFDYGPEFRVLKSLRIDDGIASACLQLGLTDEIDDYYIHPTLLDGAFQALIGAAYNRHERTVYVPTEIEQFIYWGGKHKELIAHARITKRSDKYVEGDIRLTTPEGEAVIQISGFRATSLPKGENRVRNDPAATRFYHQTWFDTEQPALLIEATKVTVLTAAPACVSLLHNSFLSYGMTVDVHDISTLEDAALLHVLSDPIGMLIYISRKETEGTGKQSIKDLLRLAQLSSAAGNGTIGKKLVVVTQGAVTADDLKGEAIDVAQACIRGFTKGLSAERADLGVRLVDIGNFLQDEATALQICAEISNQDQEDDIILRPGFRAVGRICEVRSGAAAERTFYSRDELAGGQPVGVRLVSDPSGLLDKLHYERMICEPPPPGKILFRTIASALNFKDVLKATQLLPDSVIDDTFNGDKLGMEHPPR
ncbi:type I polyketide synthase [Asaia prunellae]|uniref:type I polyketide synthase n=1 Tax=Asaia prunellae TaxID=610245 RepID=UPI001FB0B4C1|nr:type I polyketide synthase [Asaia prunellae]